jgi:hypothetical protein
MALCELRLAGLAESRREACGMGVSVSRCIDIKEKQSLDLMAQPTQLRRCLKCEEWMRSTGRDHRICNICKRIHLSSNCAGSRVTR